MYPEKSTVSFSAGLHGWAFTLTTFAKMYASKFGVDEASMIKRLWGDQFFDPATKKWTSRQTDSATCKRGFVQFIYQPIQQVRHAAPRAHARGHMRRARAHTRQALAPARACMHCVE